jgi:hypothetical protein
MLNAIWLCVIVPKVMAALTSLTIGRMTLAKTTLCKTMYKGATFTIKYANLVYQVPFCEVSLYQM